MTQVYSLVFTGLKAEAARAGSEHKDRGPARHLLASLICLTDASSTNIGDSQIRYGENPRLRIAAILLVAAGLNACLLRGGLPVELQDGLNDTVSLAIG